MCVFLAHLRSGGFRGAMVQVGYGLASKPWCTLVHAAKPVFCVACFQIEAERVDLAMTESGQGDRAQGKVIGLEQYRVVYGFLEPD